MKYLAVFCIVILAIYNVQADGPSAETKEKYRKLREKCLEKSGATLEAVKAARAGTYADDDKLAAYLTCVFVKVGFMCEDGTTHPDVMLEKATAHGLDATKAKSIIDTCVGKTYTNVEKKAYGMFQCFRDAYGESITYA